MPPVFSSSPRLDATATGRAHRRFVSRLPWCGLLSVGMMSVGLCPGTAAADDTALDRATPDTAGTSGAPTTGSTAPAPTPGPASAGTTTSAPTSSGSTVEGRGAGSHGGGASGGVSESGPSYGTRRKLLLDEPNPPADPKAYTLSLAGGAVWFDAAQDASTCGVVEKLGPNTPNFRLQLGRQWFNQLQLQLDLGIINDAIKTCGVTSEDESGDLVSLQMFSLGLGLGYRFDYKEEQPVVPYLNAGLVGTLIPISSDAGTSDSTTEEALGHRVGGYAGGGLEILLDAFSPTRAADLELSSGINDTYVVLDARYLWEGNYVQDMGLQKETQLVFYGWQVTAGLKLDF